jgi:hypothetical protein
LAQLYGFEIRVANYVPMQDIQKGFVNYLGMQYVEIPSFIGGNILEDITVREELRLKLIQAEAALKEVEEEYDLYVRQLDNYKIVIKEQKEKILMIKARMDLHIH